MNKYYYEKLKINDGKNTTIISEKTHRDFHEIVEKLTGKTSTYIRLSLGGQIIINNTLYSVSAVNTTPNL